MMPASEIEQRVRVLSPEKRALLVKRLLGSPAPTTGDSHVYGARLTAYLTTQPSAFDRSEPDSGELRKFLSRLLPEYMIPASFRVLDSMPLLPNGKVDVAALRKLADEAADGPGETWVEPRNTIERLLAGIWCEVLQMDSVSVHDNFFELGGDSILSIHVISKVSQQGLSLSPNDLFNFPTIAQLEARISAAEGERRQASPPDDVDETTPPLRNSADQRIDEDSSPVVAEGTPHPIFMVHAASEMVSLLRSHSNWDQPVYVFTADWEHADLERDTTVEQLAEQNLCELRSLQSVGPYILGGYSMGAPIALEMAHRLRIAGDSVELLFLLDPPGRNASRPSQLISDPRNREADSVSLKFKESKAIARHLTPVFGLPLTAKFRYIASVAKQQVRYRILRPIRTFIRTRVVRPAKTGLAVLYRRAGLAVPTSLRKDYVRSVYTEAWNRYEFKPYEGPVVIFHSSSTPGDKQLWEDVAKGELTVEWFEGKHHDFYRNQQLVEQWTSRLVQLLMTYRKR